MSDKDKEEANSISSPSIEEWEELYKTAMEFKEIGAWSWMWDSDIFGVQNPATGETGYCCILGKLGQCFALVVYLGTEGLEGCLKVASGEMDEKDLDVLHIKKCLMASFEDRRFLTKDDLQVVKELGLTFKGRNTWPLFRSYRAGYHPWYLTEEEVIYLILCLKQAKEIALRFRKNPDMLNPPEDNHYFVRVPKKEDKTLKWADAWLEPLPFRKIVVMVKEVDEARLKRIQKVASRQEMIWEIDLFYAPACVAEKGRRPYYPLMLLWADQYSNFILNMHVTTQDRYRVEFVEQFLNCIEMVKILPAEILVRKEELFSYLEPFTQSLDIKLSLVKRLRAIEEARAGMVEFLAKSK